MSSAINWAKLELEWDIPNPFQGRRLEEPDGRHRWLTHEEAEALIEAAKQEPQAPHLVDFILFGLNTGLRTGEMLELEWRRVDLHTNLIYLRPRDQKNKELGSVPINQQARSALIRRQSFRASHCPDSPWVFCNKKGSRIGSIKKSFATAVRRADLDDVNPHDLRRTCGGWLVQAGISLHEVSKLLRHSDVRVTEKIYAHLAPENLAHAVSVLDHRASRMLNEIDREIQNLNRTAQAIE